MNAHVLSLVLALVLAVSGVAERFAGHRSVSSRPATWADLERLTWADLEAGLPGPSRRGRGVLVVGAGVFVVEVVEALAGYFDQ